MHGGMPHAMDAHRQTRKGSRGERTRELGKKNFAVGVHAQITTLKEPLFGTKQIR